jgi:uncharacterized protein
VLLNIEKIKGLWQKLLHQEATPNHIALGFALGLFVSFLPIPPFQTVTTMVLAYLLRSNQVSALVGLHLHLLVFPVVPLILLLEYKVGQIFFHLRDAPKIDPTQFTIMSLVDKGWPLLKTLLSGAFVIGIPTAIVAFFIVRQAAHRLQKKTRGAQSAKKN